MIEFLILLRPKQWTKNLLCFAGVLFGGHFQDFESWGIASFVFLLFSIISSSVYIMNDIVDFDRDKNHPKKRFRPIASGKVSVKSGFWISIALIVIGLLVGFINNKMLFIMLTLYLINNIFYSLIIKGMPILDIFSISFGFVLRLLSGIYILGDNPTGWIVLCTIFLALFLGFSKRYSELVSLDNIGIEDANQRPVLKKYNKHFLANLVNETAFGAILAYALFSTSSGKNPTLIATVPIVYYALIYYKKLVFENQHGEEPDKVLLTDKVIWLCIVSWIILYMFITYSEIRLFI